VPAEAGRRSPVEPRSELPAASASDSDVEAVSRLLGRAPAGAFAVVVRAENGIPAVIENAPFLFDGTPMPTRFWLVDPGLCEAVSRVESTGGVRQAEAEVPTERVAEAHARYAGERDSFIGTDHRGPAVSAGLARGSSACTPIWPGGWREGTIRSGRGRPNASVSGPRWPRIAPDRGSAFTPSRPWHRPPAVADRHLVPRWRSW
jgi:hypothetical protein